MSKISIMNITQNEQAVSAVIAVTLMVAITVAMAAVGYAYLTGLIGPPVEEPPIIEFYKNEDANTLTVTYMDLDPEWEELRITAENNTLTVTIQDDIGPKTGGIMAGEQIDLDGQGLAGTVRVTIVHISSGTMVGEYILEDVTA